MSWIESFKDGLLRDEAMGNLDFELADCVLRRIALAIEELGYEYFAEDVSSGDFLGGDDSPLGSSRVNLIPSRHKGACHPVVVAVSQSASRTAAMGFPKIMRKLKAHLIECAGTTRIAIILSDQWDSKSFREEHFDEVRAHHRKGIRFLFLLVGAMGRDLTPVPVDMTH